MVRGAVWLGRAPGCVEVVFGARAVQSRRPGLAVDEDHVVAFAVPVEGVEQAGRIGPQRVWHDRPGQLSGPVARAQVVDVQVAADVVTGTFRFEDDIVARAVRIRAAKGPVRIVQVRVGNALRRILTAPLGMETAQVVVDLVVQLIVDVVVENQVDVSIHW